ncbi:MAG TPA: response regulator [Rubrivivax sp.]|nr:response regulator [Rubrivivax sp.]
MVRVLYVDDCRINGLLFAELCRCAGEVEVETVDTAAGALELVRDWAPDLLVIDLHLPDLSGYELLPALRRELGTPAPAFLCTADEAPRVEQPAREAGFDGCWTKPVELPVVLSALARFRRAAAPA